jgi:hypothetical protein
MHIYQLENSIQDKEFLSGRTISCRAVFQSANLAVKTGDYIVVLLSTGKKYKGKVVEFRSFAVENYIAGDMIVSRA